MKKTILKTIFALALAIAPFSSFAAEENEEAAVKAVVEANLKAMQDEDVAAVMATLTEKAREQSEPLYKMIFETYDLKYTLVEADIKIVSDDTAEVTAVQITEKVSGPEFKNNKLKAKHTLKKVDGKWYFESSEPIDVQFL